MGERTRQYISPNLGSLWTESSGLFAVWLKVGDWHKILKVMRNKNLQPRLLYQARLSFKIEGEIKSFSDKKKLKEFITTKPVLKEMLKGLL